ncbi:MAG: hypothetical protein Q9210_006309 [Variospora velana]
MLLFLVLNIALLGLSSGLTIPTEGRLADTPAPLINITPPLAVDPAASSNNIQIDCRGSHYGTGLSYSSCLDAFGTFTRGGAENPVTIGRRRTGKYTQNVPWRWVSGDGRCTFDIVIRGRSNFESTTGAELGRAAWKLMNECVRDQGGQGGVLSNLGRNASPFPSSTMTSFQGHLATQNSLGSNTRLNLTSSTCDLGQRGSLGIIIRPYDPVDITCGTRPQDYGQNKCDALLDTLPADVAPARTWGPRGDANVDINIPHAWQLVREYHEKHFTRLIIHLFSLSTLAPYSNCRMEVIGATRLTRDDMTFYDMWLAGAMLAGMCGRFGKAGLFSKLGAFVPFQSPDKKGQGG